MSADKNQQALTQAQTVRLECLRLVNRPDKDEQTLIDRADKFTAYVLQGTAQAGKADKAPR